MRLLDAKRIELDLQAYQNRSAEESDAELTIEEDSLVRCDGRVVLAYFADIRDSRLDAIKEVLGEIKFSESTRTNGLVTTSRIFGYAPRNEIRNHPCRAVSLATEDAIRHKVVADGATLAAEKYRETLTELASQHDAIAEEKLKASWRLAGTMFTSGIINKNNPLRYHFDRGNFRNACSAMFGVRHDVVGGRLVIPELQLKLGIGDRSLTLFDGQGLLHGVTPIRKLNEAATRYTIVYYSLQQMWNCSTPQEEIVRMRSSRTKVERKRLA